jgi:hypothetical protein
MPYAPDLHQLQIGKEVTWGTAVAATAKMGLIEEVSLTPEIEVGRNPDVRGSLVGADYVHTLDSHKASASVSGIATYEDIGYWLDSLLELDATPTGAGPYVYERNAPLTAVPTRRMITAIWGQTGAIYKMAGGIVNEFTLSFEKNKPWTFQASLIGKNVAAGALASLSDRTQTPIHANHSSLYIDAWAGTMGSTQITNPVWFAGELNIKANAELVAGIGSLSPVGYVDAAYEATLKLTLEVHSDTAAYLASILGSSLLQHQVRLKGTTGASAIAQFDFAGTHTKAPEIFSDEDGVTTFEFEMTKAYNATLANWLKTSITNSVATLP